MIELYRLGISEESIKSMIELNPRLIDMEDQEVIDKEEILRKIHCNDTQIINIISSNSLLLNNTNEEIIKLISYLTKIGFKHLNILFDSNPIILNLEPYEIDNYINYRINTGESITNIIDDLDNNPYLFNEI